MNTNKTETKYYDIVAGPNKDMLFDAFKYALSKNAKVAINLTVAAGYTAPIGDPGRACIPMAITDVEILGIEYEDGSGESFNLHGFCRANLDSSKESNMAYKQYRFESYYNAKSRKGRISFK